MNGSSPAARPIAPLFESKFKTWPGGSIGHGHELPLRIDTPPEPWAYAFRADRAGAPVPGAVCVRVEIEVHAGVVGVGCLHQSETAFIDEEIVESGAGPRSVDLVALDAETVGALVVRNASMPGPGRVTVHDIACFALAGDERDGVRVPGLSEPRPARGWSRYYGDVGDTILEKFRSQAFRALAEPTVVRWSDGLALHILPGDSLSRAVFVSGTYEPNSLCVLQRFLGPGDVFLDAGANAGVISLAASRWVGPTGRVYALEPSAREYQRLLATLELNGATNVTAVRTAVCERQGHATLRVAGSAHGGLNTLGDRFAYEGVETVRVETVETTSLDLFAARMGPGRVAAVKLDIEGSEGLALAGSTELLRAHRPIVMMEVLDRALRANGSSVQAVERLLADARYRLYVIDDDMGHLTPRADLGDVDEVNVVAVPAERDRPAA
jgi:FkbM family methyltransferase